jgi:WD40 repeat protein
MRTALVVSVVGVVIGATWLFVKRTSGPPEILPSAVLQNRGYGTILSLSISPDGQKLASAADLDSGSGVVTVWNLEQAKGLAHSNRTWGDNLEADAEVSKQCIAAKKEVDSVLALQFSPDGKTLYACGGEVFVQGADLFTRKKYFGLVGYVLFLDGESLKIERRIQLKWAAYGLALSPNGKLLSVIGTSDDGIIRVGLWDVESRQERLIEEFSGPSVVEQIGTPFRHIVFSHDGKKLFAMTEPGTIKVIDVDAPKSQTALKLPECDAQWFDLSADDRSVLSYRESTIDSDCAGPQGMARIPSPCRYLDLNRVVCGIPRYPSGARIFSGRVVELTSGKSVVQLKGTIFSPSSIAVTDDGRTVAIGDTQSGGIQVWTLPDLSE